VHFSPLCFAEERPVAAEGSLPLWNRELGGKLLLGKDKSESGRNTLALSQTKYRAGVTHICKAQKNFDGSMLCVKHVSLGVCPYPGVSESTSAG